MWFSQRIFWQCSSSSSSSWTCFLFSKGAARVAIDCQRVLPLPLPSLPPIDAPSRLVDVQRR